MSEALSLFSLRLGVLLRATTPEHLASLRAAPPDYRTEVLLTHAADLADVVAGYESGVVGADTVREQAVAVAAEAARIWLATVGGTGHGNG